MSETCLSIKHLQNDTAIKSDACAFFKTHGYNFSSQTKKHNKQGSAFESRCLAVSRPRQQTRSPGPTNAHHLVPSSFMVYSLNLFVVNLVKTLRKFVFWESQGKSESKLFPKLLTSNWPFGPLKDSPRPDPTLPTGLPSALPRLSLLYQALRNQFWLHTPRQKALNLPDV